MKRMPWAAVTAMATSGLTFSIAVSGMLSRHEPFYTWFYLFAWWSSIVFAEGLLRFRGGPSELFDHPRRFLATLPLSVVFWLVFEAYNFRLQNWHYWGVPLEWELRWTGYALSFATVLPGLKVAQRLLEHFTALGGKTGTPRGDLRALHPVLVGLGVFCLVSPLLAPRICFPLIWVGFILLLDPINHRLGGASLLRDLETGWYGRIFLIPLAGLCCGLMWEAWNFRAGAKWTYSIPWFGFGKVFEMPILGFLGFAPFALEAHVLSNSASLARRWIGGLRHPGARLLVCLLLTLAALCFTVAVFRGIDRLTVVGYRA